MFDSAGETAWRARLPFRMPRRTWLSVACGAGVVENARWAAKRIGDEAGVESLEMGDIEDAEGSLAVREWRAAGEKKLRRSAEAMMRLRNWAELL